MFPARKINKIKSIAIHPPLKISNKILTNSISEIGNHFLSDTFFGLRMNMELIPPEKTEIHGYILKFNFIPPNNAKPLTQWAQGFCELYDCLYLTNFHIIFALNQEGNIIEFATDLEPDIFRKILVLSPTLTQSLNTSLVDSDYWLGDAAGYSEQYKQHLLNRLRHMFPQNNNKLLEAFINKDPYSYSILNGIKSMGINPLFKMLRPQAGQEKRIPSEKEKMISALQKEFCLPKFIEPVHSVYMRYVGESMKELEERKPDKNGLSPFDQRRNFTFKKAKMRYPYLKDSQKNNFLDSFDPLAIDLTKEQIGEQLRTAGILNSSGHQSKLVLFVGSGTGRIEAKIKADFPHLYCFALEPLEEVAHTALKEKNIPHHRQLIMTLQELPECYKFDLIFVLNYNIFFSQDEFFDKLYASLKDGGSVIIGRANIDAEHIYSNKTIGTYLKERFGEVTYPGWVQPGTRPDYNYRLCLYQGTKKPGTSPGIRTQPPTTTEAYINTLNQQAWQEMTKTGPFTAGALLSISINQITLFELDIASGLADKKYPGLFFALPQNSASISEEETVLATCPAASANKG